MLFGAHPTLQGLLLLFMDGCQENIDAVVLVTQAMKVAPQRFVRRGQLAQLPSRLGVPCNMPLCFDYLKMSLTGSAPFQTTRRGKDVPAKAETAEEFVDIMSELRDRVKYVLPKPLYCFDQPSIHVGPTANKHFKAQGFIKEDFFSIPPYSGVDFNKVVEHAHSRLKRFIQPWINAQVQGLTMPELFRMIDIGARKVNDPTVIRGDVMSLRQTYKGIIERRGGYGPKRDR
jgi:hypothetical protein